jgi:hypothetical protein
MKRLAMMCAALALCSGAEAAGTNKQELVNKVLKLWHVESIGESMLQQPVGNAVQQARVMLQGRAAPEKRDAALNEIAEDARKFMDENKSVTRASAEKLIPTTIAPLLAERFTEEELKQIIAILESPVKAKFEAMVPELQKKLGESVAADTRTVIDPKLQDLQQRIGMRLRSAVTP